VILKEPHIQTEPEKSSAKLIVILSVKLEKLELLACSWAKSPMHSADWKEVRRQLIPAPRLETTSNPTVNPQRVG